jgi:hypothetical protein
MQYLNPYELLELAPNADESSIKKAKRRRMADLDLNEGFLTLGEHKVYKSDFIQLSQALEDPEQARYYAYLLGNLPLHRFLSEGDTDFFKSNTKQAIFEDKKFLAFIGPFFAAQYDRCLSKAFRAKDWAKVQLLGAGPVLVSPQQQEKAYESTVRHWQQFHQDCQELLEELNEEEDSYDLKKIDALLQRLDREQWIKGLNLLPDYFQTQRNDTAKTLRSISVGVFNNLDDVDRAQKLIEKAQELNLSGTAKQQITEAFKQLKEIQSKRKIQQEQEKEAKGLLEAFIYIHKLTEEVEEKGEKMSASLGERLRRVQEQIQPLKKRQFTGDIKEILDKLCIALRQLAIELCNQANEYDKAQTVLTWVLELNPSSEIKLRVQKDQKDIQNLIKSIENQFDEYIQVISNINIQLSNLPFNMVVNNEAVLTNLNRIFDHKSLQTMKTGMSINQKYALIQEMIKLMDKVSQKVCEKLLSIAHSINKDDDCLSHISRMTQAMSQKARRSQLERTISSYTPPKPSSSNSSSNDSCIDGCVKGIGECFMEILLKIVSFIVVFAIFGAIAAILSAIFS